MATLLGLLLLPIGADWEMWPCLTAAQQKGLRVAML